MIRPHFSPRVLFLVALATLGGTTTAPAQLGPSGAERWELAMLDPPPGLVSDRFGAALAAGDFDGDGHFDLAIGVLGLDVGTANGAGGVVVLYGSATGPTVAGRQVWSQDSTGVPDTAESFDQFGRALAVGDFDGDGFDDLVIGIRESLPGSGFQGAVQILSGGPTGLAAADDGFWHQGAAGLVDQPEQDDLFGCFGLATGDLDGDSFDELAIGVPGEDEENGAVHLLFGSKSGLTALGNRLFRRGDGAIPGTPLPPGAGPEFLGLALAIGDFVPATDGLELAAGVPTTSLETGASFAGSLMIVSDFGGTPSAVEHIQGQAGLPGVAESDDQFGFALAAGDFDGDGFDELAVGSPRETVDGLPISAVGSLFVLDFSTPDAHQVWSQQDLAPELSEAGDLFGSVLVVGDFDGDGVADLAIGVPDEDLGPVASTGTVHVLHGSIDTGLTTVGAQIWLPTTDASHFGERFGAALVAAPFIGGAADLAIGIPGEDGAGAVELLRAALFADGFESGDGARWSLSVP